MLCVRIKPQTERNNPMKNETTIELADYQALTAVFGEEVQGYVTKRFFEERQNPSYVIKAPGHIGDLLKHVESREGELKPAAKKLVRKAYDLIRAASAYTGNTTIVLHPWGIVCYQSFVPKAETETATADTATETATADTDETPQPAFNRDKLRTRLLKKTMPELRVVCKENGIRSARTTAETITRILDKLAA